MDPATRNRVLMIGGGLVVIALLLVCGPLEGRFGGEKRGAERTPDVAAAPPPEPVVPPVPEIDPTEAAGSVIAGATTGAAIGESALADAAGAAGKGASAPAVVAAPPVPVRGAGGGSGGGAGAAKAPSATLPAVSAAGPPAPVLPTPPSAEELAASAARDFDASLPSLLANLDGESAASRFAPPVDSGPRVSPVAAAAQGFNNLSLRPCDDPGAGCRNLAPRRAAVPVPFGGGSSGPPRP